MEQHKKKPTFWSNVKALFFGMLVSLVLLEVCLRIFHPIPFRIKHGKIVLPAYQKVVHNNLQSNKLEHVISYSRNSMGLRGEEMPQDAGKWIKIITIGGSTTECSYNSDSLTWPELLKGNLRKTVAPNIWVNNAGLDGTSTFGHILLLKEHIVSLHPDYVIFLTGVNDMEEKAMGGFDKYNSDEWDTRSIKDFLRSLVRKTETGALIENLYRSRVAYRQGLTHREVDYAKTNRIIIDNNTIQKEVHAQTEYLGAYQKRILTLDSICKANNIKALFLTQPSLFASFTDPVTRIDFATLEIAKGRNAFLQGKILQCYNNVVLGLRNEGRINAIDLASAVPKDSRYFYDYTHYTSVGTKVVAQIVSDSLQNVIAH